MVEKIDQMPQRYKILITGSSGMLGIDLCQELSGKYELYGTDVVHRTSYIVHRFTKADITDKESVVEIVKKIKPDVVIHTAAWTDVDGCELNKKKTYRVNVEGTKNIALACKICGATLIYISTDFVFDGKRKSAYKETDRPKPISAYGESKLKGEEAVKNELKKYFILRTSWLYGKHGKNFVDTILAEAKSPSAKALKVVNDQVGSPTYTRDLARAIRTLLDKVIGHRSWVIGRGYGTYHISNSGSVSWFEYTKEILRLAKSGTKVVPISSEELARPARRPAMSVLDNSKFMKFTGYRMRDWKSALKEYLLKEK